MDEYYGSGGDFHDVACAILEMQLPFGGGSGVGGQSGENSSGGW